MAHIGIGLDFGTSNTTAAVYDGRNISYIRLDDLTEEGVIMPTALYLDREFHSSTGSEAILKYLQDNTSRRIVLTDKEIGCITVHMGEMDRDHTIERDRTYTQVITGKIDAELPGRLFKSMKSYLGDKGDPRFDVFGRKFRLEAILTIILRHIAEKITDFTKENEFSLCIGRPVLYSGTAADSESLALNRMKLSGARAGMENFSFMLEPEAAALSYLHSHKSGGKENILVFDFGGGTMDLCVLEKSEHNIKFLGAAGIPRAGDNIDRMIFRNKVAPLLGAGLSFSHNFHYAEFEDYLLNWQSTYLLNQAVYIEKINTLIKAGGSAKEKGLRLKKLVRCNGSFQLLEQIEQAKIELSGKDCTSIVMEEIDLDVDLTRTDLEDILSPVFSDIDQVVREVLEIAELKKAQLNRIVCTGGSSRIPAVRKYIASLLGKEPEEWNSFRGIAAGLAVAAYREFSTDAKSGIEINEN